MRDKSIVIVRWTCVHIILVMLLGGVTTMTTTPEPLQVFNITRHHRGDRFLITGGECGVTRCTEVTRGTAISAGPPGDSSEPCMCRCGAAYPILREDKLVCVDDIAECPVIEFKEGEERSKLPLIFLPLSGQIIQPSKTIEFPEAENTVCAVSSSQYLTKTGWTSLRNNDGDVPFMFYRDEGKTYLQWRGSEEARSKVAGRVVLVRVACRLGRLLLSPCVAFRVQGIPVDLPHDVSEVWFSGDVRVLSSPREASNPSSGPSSNDSPNTMQIMGFMGIALLLCAVIAIILYGTALLFYLKNKGVNNRSITSSEEVVYNNNIQISAPKMNPLMSFLHEKAMGNDNIMNNGESSSFSSSETSTERLSKESNFRLRENNNQISGNQVSTALVHLNGSQRNPVGGRHFCSSSSLEKCPESHISIVEGPFISSPNIGIQLPVNAIPLQRKRLYFNPSFFEPHFLRSPPPAAIEFLTKIREVIKVAKVKMVSNRFTPSLPVIIEEKPLPKRRLPYESFNTKHSAKKENMKIKTACVGCPGCTERKFTKTYLRTLSEREFCKSCVSTEFKQDIVRKWLDDVPVITETSKDEDDSITKSVGTVSGTPRSINPASTKNELYASARRRKKLPPPPPPPIQNANKLNIISDEDKVKKEDELKEKMNAVINELEKYRKIEAITPRSLSPVAEVVTPFIPKSIVPVTPKVVFPVPIIKSPEILNYAKIENKRLTSISQLYEVDSLERNPNRRRKSVPYNNSSENSTAESHKRRSSIIAMKELEPMKKIHDMNSRLSHNYQSTENITDKEKTRNNTKWEAYSIKRKNLVSEVYINDDIKTFDSSDQKITSNNDNKQIKYTEPFTKPGQLVIKVEDPPKTFYPKEVDDFDPDTLDRKPDRLKIHKEIDMRRPIEKMFLTSADSFNSSDHTKKPNLRPSKSNRIGSLREIYEAKLNSTNYRYFGSSYETLNTIAKNTFDSGTNRFEAKDEKPFLSPKKLIDQSLSSSFTSKTFIKSEVLEKNNYNKQKSPAISFKITKSEPPMDYYNRNCQERPNYNREHSPSIVSEIPKNCKFISIEANYENVYTLPERVKIKKEPKKLNGKSASRQRHQKMHQSKFHKTEDSGYLSSDSNESRKMKSKFILQVKDREDEVGSDTDEVESVGDARSESGGESIETNSVFFGSLRRLSMMRKQREESCSKTDDDKSEKDCANVISVVHPRERLPDLENL